MSSNAAKGSAGVCAVSTLFLVYAVTTSGSLVLTECAWLSAFSTAVLVVATYGDSLAKRKGKGGKYTYGFARVPVLAVFSSTALVQLSSVFLLKESLESILDLGHHHGAHESNTSLFILSAIAVSLSLVLAAYAIPHNPFNHVLAAASSSIVQEHAADLSHAICSVIPGLSRILLPRINALTLLASLSTVSCFLTVNLVESYEWIDAICAVFLALAAFSTMMPLSTYTGLILLQTVPAHVRNQIDRCLAEAQTIEGVLELRETHFWQIDFSQIAGSVDVRIRKDANEQLVLASVTEKLSGLVNTLTVQVLKDVTTSWNTLHAAVGPPPVPIQGYHHSTPVEHHDHGHEHGHSHDHGAHGHSHDHVRHH
ncbi:unnamed protein product [Bursaphelenchus xylophilus]|uniref:(pine wood nematode) hypothetical protein n=1 Tax=Bursaphelenchus xylophilus TaxID=6326 RepID=A0A1I7SQ47_BURXY|nr:unnamed protein product [Bursaphelenchus xylophilus]CAG9109597.1 unnamed protein product [Bursaphelenchus xylophilus]